MMADGNKKAAISIFDLNLKRNVFTSTVGSTASIANNSSNTGSCKSFPSRQKSFGILDDSSDEDDGILSKTKGRASIRATTTTPFHLQQSPLLQSQAPSPNTNSKKISQSSAKPVLSPWTHSFFDDDDDAAVTNSSSALIAPELILIPVESPSHSLRSSEELHATESYLSSFNKRTGPPKKQRAAPDSELSVMPPHDDYLDFEAFDSRPGPERRRHPEQPLVLPGANSIADSEVNKYLAACLMDYQTTGVSWLWDKYCQAQGCILADDMGLGKTVQAISLLCGIYRKTGSASDLTRNKAKRRGTQPSKPSLIVVPASVIENWTNELDIWGYFIIESIGKASEAHQIIERASAGRVDVVLCSYDKMTKYSDALAAIDWEVVVWDEGHQLCNEGSDKYRAAARISTVRFRCILTGTPMQNRPEELWPLFNLITRGHFREKEDFKNHFVGPIRRSLKAGASEEARALGSRRKDELQGVLGRYLLQRSKEAELGSQLKGKREIVVFCDLSPLQKQLYLHLLSLPDFNNVRIGSLPCPCGSGCIRRACCLDYRCPMPQDPQYDKAVIWHQQHPDGEPCMCGDGSSYRCPGCCFFPCMMKLMRVVSHPSLIQGLEHLPANNRHNEKIVEFVSRALTPGLLRELGGVYQARDFLTACNPSQSGKMMALKLLLEMFTASSEKVLVFSHSTRVLDLIEKFIKASGWSYCRLDGTTVGTQRQGIIDRYNNDKSLLIFLLSTKAGGLGINLTSASKVIQFDVLWNPSGDRQAQDRSYRMGQKNEVTVYRLIAQGTIEEQIYMRQLYKNALSTAVLGGKAEHHRFEGVEGECEGELFGAHNLFTYDGGSILQRLKNKYGIEATAGGKQGDGLKGLKHMEETEVRAVLQQLPEEEPLVGEALVDSLDAVAELRKATKRTAPQPQAEEAVKARKISSAAADARAVTQVVEGERSLISDDKGMDDVRGRRENLLKLRQQEGGSKPGIQLARPNYGKDVAASVPQRSDETKAAQQDGADVTIAMTMNMEDDDEVQFVEKLESDPIPAPANRLHDACVGTVPDASGSPDGVTSVRFELSNGKTVDAIFCRTNTIQEVHEFLETYFHNNRMEVTSFVISTKYPRVVLISDKRDITIEKAGIHHREKLLVQITSNTPTAVAISTIQKVNIKNVVATKHRGIRPNSTGTYGNDLRLRWDSSQHGDIIGSEFLEVRPTQVLARYHDSHWIQVSSRVFYRGSTHSQPTEGDGIFPKLYEIRRKVNLKERITEDEKRECLTEIRRRTTDTSGKWLMYVYPNKIDAVWRCIAIATAAGTFWSSKVATSPNERGTFLICVYCPNFRDETSVERTLRDLFNLSLGVSVSSFKPDVYTDLNIYTHSDGGIWKKHCTIHGDILKRNRGVEPQVGVRRTLLDAFGDH